MFEYFVRPHICLFVSVYGTFYFNLGLVREGCGFDFGSCFLGVVVSVFLVVLL